MVWSLSPLLLSFHSVVVINIRSKRNQGRKELNSPDCIQAVHHEGGAGPKRKVSETTEKYCLLAFSPWLAQDLYQGVHLQWSSPATSIINQEIAPTDLPAGHSDSIFSMKIPCQDDASLGQVDQSGASIPWLMKITSEAQHALQSR